MISLAFQPELRPELPKVFAHKDYRNFREQLLEMDRILKDSGLEDTFAQRHLMKHAETMNERQILFRSKVVRTALRHSILLALSGLSYREFATRLADSRLYQWFTNSEQIDAVRSASKSTVKRFDELFADGEIEQLIHDLNRAATSGLSASDLLLRDEPLKIDSVYADTTCVEANIHFPVDWVLLRDAVRTLTKSVARIRAQGLVNRMSSPGDFRKQMNRLCIEMTHARRTKGAKKKRKFILRKMKKLTKTVRLHAERHRDLLIANREETDWSEAQAAQVLGNIKNVLDQLPDAIHQAHERIIGERLIPNAEKILSLYDPDVHVIVRGKAGASVEFGNALYLAEQQDGLIIDWQFIQSQPPSDSKLVKMSVERIIANYGLPTDFATDRGFCSKTNDKLLENLGIFNAICPKSVPELRERLKDERFSRMQTRRASTEARIGILENGYIGAPLRSKGFKNRKTRIGWCILTHNLWKLAGIAAEERRKRRETQAA